MKKTFAIYLLSCMLFSCNLFHKPHNSQKLGTHDPFKNTMVKSEFFDFDSRIGHVIEGKKGTIISFPKGCLVNSNGEEVLNNVKVELAEALSYDDMLLSNLTATSNGAPLETGGMIYLNVKGPKGEKLSINKKKPAEIQIPTKSKKPGMQAYTGERDDNGKMNWVEPKPVEDFLINVDLKELDFLPTGFEAAVKKGMPFKNYKVATKELADSLYYSFSSPTTTSSSIEQVISPAPAQRLNEPYYNRNKQIVNGQYTKESYNVGPGPKTTSEVAESKDSAAIEEYGIDPAIIKTITSEKFQHTFIATKEFQSRLQAIFETCKSAVLMLYINNLDKPLWRVDELAAKQLGEGTYAGKKFLAFAALKQTNVNTTDANENAALLKAYFDTQLKAVRGELQKLATIAQQQIQEHNRVVDSVSDAYREMLWKREKYRMQRYNFTWTNVGWINIDVAVAKVSGKLDVTVKNGKSYDRVEAYIVYEEIKSIYHLETLDKETHFVGREPERSMVMPIKQRSKLVAVAYKGDSSTWMGVTDFITTSSEHAAINNLVPTTEKDVKRVLNEIENGTFKGDIGSTETKGEQSFGVSKPGTYAEQNSVAVDLGCQNFFYKESKYQEKLARENIFMNELWGIAFPCACENGELAIVNGRSLFNSNCKSCHNILVDGTGPDLSSCTKRHTMAWLVSFTHNWHDLVDAGDADAIATTRSRPTQMNVFTMMKDCDVRAIFKYIDSQNRASAM